MLVARDGSWAICMPKKTGSHSLVRVLAPHNLQDSPENQSLADLHDGFHGCEWDGTGKRIMVVRRPLDRLASMYWHHCSEGGIYLGPGGVVEWLERFLSGSQDEWTIQQSTMRDRFRPDVIVRLEDGLQRVLELIGVPGNVGHWHATEGRRSTGETFVGLSDTLSLRVADWCRTDEVLH